MNSELIAIIFCVLIGAVLISPMAMARKRAPEELGKSPVFEAFCFGRIGTFAGANIPIFRLSIYKEFIAICCITPRVIPYKELNHTEVRKEFLSSRIYIETTEGTSYLLSVKNAKTVLAYIESYRV